MKIEVNTKEDSKEEIMHAIKLLMTAAGLKGQEVFSNDISEIKESKEDDGMLDIFSDSNQSEPKKDNDGYINLFAPNEEKEEESIVIEEKSQPTNPLASFFGDIEPSATTIVNEEEEDNEDEREEEKDSLNTFFKEYDDDENNNDKSKKPRIKFY